MPYRKFKADLLFTGNHVLGQNSVLITDEAGVIQDIVQLTEAGDDVEVFEGLLSPGFVNCHCHLELSHLKNVIEPGTGLVDFLIKVVGLRSSSNEEIQNAMLTADAEMFNNGIVAAGDVCNTNNSISVKLKSRISYCNFIEVIGFTEENGRQRLAPYVSVYKEFCDAGFAAHSSIVPHAPYTVSHSMFQLIGDLSTGKIISIHNQESLAEDELYRNKTGDFLRLYDHLHINIDFFQPCNNSSLQTYLPFLRKARKLILVHNTCTTQADLDFALKQAVKDGHPNYWCLCPNANMYIENRLPPVELFIQNRRNIVLGTDSYASNTGLNILDEIKTLHKNFPFVQMKDLLQWATFNGAKALGLDDKFGSFEKRKQPGVLLISNLVNNNIGTASTLSRLL